MYSGNMRVIGGLSNSFIPTASVQSKTASDVSGDSQAASGSGTNGYANQPVREKRLSKHKEELQHEFKIDKGFSLLRYLGTGAYGIVA